MPYAFAFIYVYVHIRIYNKYLSLNVCQQTSVKLPQAHCVIVLMMNRQNTQRKRSRERERLSQFAGRESELCEKCPRNTANNGLCAEARRARLFRFHHCPCAACADVSIYLYSITRTFHSKWNASALARPEHRVLFNHLLSSVYLHIYLSVSGVGRQQKQQQHQQQQRHQQQQQQFVRRSSVCPFHVHDSSSISVRSSSTLWSSPVPARLRCVVASLVCACACAFARAHPVCPSLT